MAGEGSGGFKVNIDPATVNKYVADAILDSVLGTQIKKVITEEMENLTNTHSVSPIRKAITTEIGKLIYVMLTAEDGPYKKEIERLVKERMTGDVLNDIVNGAFDLCLARYN